MGGGKRAHGRPGSNLGAALKSARDKKHGKHLVAGEKERGTDHLHVSEIHKTEAHTVDLAISSTEPDHIADFLATVQMANKEFNVEHPAHHEIKIIDTTINTDYAEAIRQMNCQRQDIAIPRRPVWNESTTKEQLDRAEKDAFLDWRRILAEKEEERGVVFTPFEKNIEFWRQLWRVIERSDLVVQLVDARRPLLFRCADLERYVLEVAARQGDAENGKENLLLLYVNPPPLDDIDKEAFREWTIETEKDEAKLARRLMLVEKKMLEGMKLDSVDKSFFAQASVKGVTYARPGQDGKFQLERTNRKQRLQDLKPKKKDKARRVREKKHKQENAGVPDWLC